MTIFSTNLKTTLDQAKTLCQQENGSKISPGHLFQALVQTKGTLAYDILSQLEGAGYPKAKALVAKKNVAPVFANKVVQILEHAGTLALQFHHSYIGTEHVLAAILDLEPKTVSARGLPVEKIRTHLTTILNSSSHIPNFSKIFQNHVDNSMLPHPPATTRSSIESFTIELTDAERQKQINPVIGRDAELNQLIQILCRKDKNNPVILGDAGVGKTAIVEGLAKKILEHNVPPILMNKQILNLDLGLMVAGTTYRGDFENRIKTLVEEMEDRPNTILFIDELHNLVGAGSANGTMDAANLLKPLLARGKLRCIGATTPAEYKKHIEADPALERRFQPINLSAPSEAETLEILEGIKNNYQVFHGVSFTREALETAVSLSVRYIQDKLLPDKAIDLLDEAAAKVKIRYQKSNPLFLRERNLEEELDKIYFEKEDAILHEEFSVAIKIKEAEKAVEAELAKTRAELRKLAESQKNLVTKQDIITLVSERTKIPVQELAENDYGKIAQSRDKIKQDIIGQDAAIDQVLRVISQTKLGFVDESKPLASFLFLGSSGVGKTFLAKTLAKEFFPEEAFIQLDMSEFHENFQATKLVGAPAGYVGYREGNKFTDLVKKNPYSLILLDELEKAHPDVIDLFLQILEYGHLTDSLGRKINFKNTIIVMTTNILADKFNKKEIGFSGQAAGANKNFLPELKKHFKPEFVNRIGHVVAFNDLDQAAIAQILTAEIQRLTAKLKLKGFQISVPATVAAMLSTTALQQGSGARAVKNIISQQVEQPILDRIILGKNKKIGFKIIDNRIVIG